MLILTVFIRNLSQSRVFCGFFETFERVYAFGSFNTFGAFETANGFLSFEAFLSAESLHCSIVCEVVGEAIDLYVILFVHMGFPALKPLVVYEISNILASLFIKKLI